MVYSNVFSRVKEVVLLCIHCPTFHRRAENWETSPFFKATVEHNKQCNESGAVNTSNPIDIIVHSKKLKQ